MSSSSPRADAPVAGLPDLYRIRNPIQSSGYDPGPGLVYAF
jgi:hypothetical protein